MNKLLNRTRKIAFLPVALAVILSLPLAGEAQLPVRPETEKNIPRQSVYLELLGNGLLYSFNYDAIFDSGFGFRLGTNYFPHDFNDRNGKPPWQYSYRSFSAIIMGLHMTGNGIHSVSRLSLVPYGKQQSNSESRFYALHQPWKNLPMAGYRAGCDSILRFCPLRFCRRLPSP